MIVTKFHENRLTIDREINEKHAILVDNFSCDFGYSISQPHTSQPALIHTIHVRNSH